MVDVDDVSPGDVLCHRVDLDKGMWTVFTRMLSLVDAVVEAMLTVLFYVLERLSSHL